MDVKRESPSAQRQLVDDKDPTVSFAKSRRAIAGTMAKFQIPTLTSRTSNKKGGIMVAVKEEKEVDFSSMKQFMIWGG